MLDKLGEWYRSMGIEPEDAQIKARWPGVEAWAKKATLDQALNTVRLYRRIPPADEGFRSAFQAVFIEADTTFRTKGNDNELIVLSAACISHMIESTKPSKADVLAYATACSRMSVPAATALIEDLESQCDTYLAQRAVSVRQFPATNSIAPKEKTLSGIRKLPEVLVGSDVKVVAEALGPILADLVNVVAEASKSVERADKLHRESSDVVWWLFAGRSTQLRVPFETLESASAAFVVAGELAARTRFSPGFHAASQFLSASLSRNRAKPLSATSTFAAAAALDTSAFDLFGAEAELDPVVGLTPCLSAINRRRTKPDPALWQRLHEADYPQQGSRTFPPEALARQAYDELIFRRTLAGWEAK